MRPTRSAAVFAFVVLLCLTQVGWWIVFQFRETARLEEAAGLLARDEVAAAVRVLGVDETGSLAGHIRRRRWMFASEGAVLGLCVLIGVVFFYAGWVRERRMRREQDRFLTGATHELKTPLATVRLGLESMLAGRTPAERRDDYLRMMVGEVDRLERGVTNLLTAAGLRGQKPELRMTVGDLATDVEGVAAEFVARLEATGVGLDAELGRPAPVLRDGEAIRTVVRNLLDNAIKYSPRGGSIRVVVQRRDDRVELRVADRGAGMSADELRRAFDPFYRGADKAHVGGSGLGLHLVRELVVAHGGSVEARSDGADRGSEFVLRLPLVEEGA